MRLPMWWELFSGGGHGSAAAETSKGKSPKVSDYARDRQACAPLTAGLILFALVIVFICIFDNGGWDAATEDQQHRWTTTRDGIADQSVKLEWDLDARQKAGALHGMGVTFRAGSRAMNELVIAHLAEPTTANELRMFLRTLHRSGATARADVVLLFPWSLTEDITAVIDDEERSFRQLLLERQATAPPHSKKVFDSDNKVVKESETQDGETVVHAPEIRPFPPSNSTISPFNARAFWKSREERKVRGEMLVWENATALVNGSDELAAVDWADWGSIVGFEMQDLDQGDVLEGFIEDPPAQLRRWTCYQMLLGMIKSRYRIVLLTEVRGVFILRDVLASARKKAFDSTINLYVEDLSWNDVHKARKKRLAVFKTPTQGGADDHVLPGGEISAQKSDGIRDPPGPPGNGDSRSDDEARGSRSSSQEMHFIEEVYGKEVWKKLDREEKEKAALGSAFIIGDIRPIRSLSNAMLTEIASLALKRKSRLPFHDRALLNHLVQKSSVLSRRVTGKLHMLSSAEAPIHSLPGSKQPSIFFRSDGHGFAALLGLADELVPQDKAVAIANSILYEICSTPSESWAYPNCSPLP